MFSTTQIIYGRHNKVGEMYRSIIVYHENNYFERSFTFFNILTLTLWQWPLNREFYELYKSKYKQFVIFDLLRLLHWNKFWMIDWVIWVRTVMW